MDFSTLLLERSKQYGILMFSAKQVAYIMQYNVHVHVELFPADWKDLR